MSFEYDRSGEESLEKRFPVQRLKERDKQHSYKIFQLILATSNYGNL